MKFHKDSAFDTQFKRSIGHCANGGAELSECFSAIANICPGDYKGWHNSWRALGDKLNRSAEIEAQQKSLYNAGHKLLRSSNYYRTAYFFLEENPNDKRISECLELSKYTFERALKLLGISYIPLKIPFEDIFLPGYLYFGNASNSKMLIDTGGGDSTLEELYFYSANPCLKRGYHCLTFEGPGQGSVLRIQKRPFRPDWENVIKSVIDYLEKEHSAIAQSIILRGDSFGGYLATRAVAYEKRIKACVVNPGIFSAAGNLEKLNKRWLRSLIFYFFPESRFKLQSRFMRFGAHSFSEMVEIVKTFNNQNEVKKISCPILVIDNEEENITKGEAIKLYQELKCPKTYHLFKKEDFSGGHCQPLAQLNTQEIIFNWIEATLNPSPK